MIDRRHPPSNRHPPDHAYLTEGGRRILEERIRLFEATVVDLRDAPRRLRAQSRQRLLNDRAVVAYRPGQPIRRHPTSNGLVNEYRYAA